MNRRTIILRAVAALALLTIAWLTGYTVGASREKADAASRAAQTGTSTASRDTDPARIGIPTPAKRDGAFDHLAHTPWTRERIETAIASVTRDPSIFRGIRTALRLADSLTAEDFPAVLDNVGDLHAGDDIAGIVKIAIMARWMEINPRAAADYLQKNKELGGFIDIPGEFLAGAFAAADPADGIRWAKENGDTGHAHKIIKALARRDPEEARAFALAHLPDLPPVILADLLDDDRWQPGTPEEIARRIGEKPGTGDIRAAAVRWAATDPAKAFAWAATLTDKSDREAALDGAIVQWSTKDPALAAEQILQMKDLSAIGTNTISNLTDALIAADLPRAAQWATALPDAQARAAAFPQIARHLAEKDLPSSAAWIDTLPPSSERDEAIRSFAAEAISKEPETAMQWAFSMQSPARRAENARNLMGQWFTRDPAAAYHYLSESPDLTHEDRALILSPRAEDNAE